MKFKASMAILTRFGLLMFMMITSASTYGQEKVLVKYDPLFWKDQLKLSNDQYVKIRDINYEYYQKLISVSKDNTNRGSLKGKAEAYLEERSNQIWNTFHSRQKKKWMKISAS